MALGIYPYGYSGAYLSMAQVEQQTTVRKLNFEFWRRTKALMIAADQEANVRLGIGTGWRVQPANGGPGFASPGNSNHEGFPADGVSGGAVAADMVLSTSWGWMGANVARFGLRTFTNVNNEPWHIQPIEIPASRNYRRVPWVLDAFPLPGDWHPPPPPPPINQEDDMDLWARFYGENQDVAFSSVGWRYISEAQRNQYIFMQLLRDHPKGSGYPIILGNNAAEGLAWKSSHPQLG